jgi:hypothetical protein
MNEIKFHDQIIFVNHSPKGYTMNNWFYWDKSSTTISATFVFFFATVYVEKLLFDLCSFKNGKFEANSKWH